jgi:hypothetical protein
MYLSDGAALEGLFGQLHHDDTTDMHAGWALLPQVGR